MGFFDRYEVFQRNWKGERRHPNRLNERFRRIVEPNLAHIRGKRVLDIGSHDGRWSMAAVANGASYVRGVEGRADLVARARETFRAAGVAAAACEFVVDDFYRALETNRDPFDTVLCLGVLYHVADHHRLMRLMAATGATAIILDTGVVPTESPLVELRFERTDNGLHALPDYGEEALIGLPARGALPLLARSIGFTLRYVPWNLDDIADPRGLDDYRTGGRVTAVLERI